MRKIELEKRIEVRLAGAWSYFRLGGLGVF